MSIALYDSDNNILNQNVIKINSEEEYDFKQVIIEEKAKYVEFIINEYVDISFIGFIKSYE